MIEQSIRLLLQQLTALLTQLKKDEYATALPVLNKASIGKHVRHVVELFQALLTGYEEGQVHYDGRKRDPVLELDNDAAITALSAIAAQLIKPDRELLLAGNYTVQGHEEVRVRSSFYRELVYNLEHTVHHMAIIRIAVQQTTTIPLPDEFGMAASTLRHKKTCAQ